MELVEDAVVDRLGHPPGRLLAEAAAQVVAAARRGSGRRPAATASSSSWWRPPSVSGAEDPPGDRGDAASRAAGRRRGPRWPPAPRRRRIASVAAMMASAAWRATVSALPGRREPLGQAGAGRAARRRSATTGPERKLAWRNSPRLRPIWSLRLGMIRRVRDRDAERVAEHRGDGEPVGQPADHGRLRGGPHVADPGAPSSSARRATTNTTVMTTSSPVARRRITRELAPLVRPRRPGGGTRDGAAWQVVGRRGHVFSASAGEVGRRPLGRRRRRAADRSTVTATRRLVVGGAELHRPSDAGDPAPLGAVDEAVGRAARSAPPALDLLEGARRSRRARRATRTTTHAAPGTGAVLVGRDEGAGPDGPVTSDLDIASGRGHLGDGAAEATGQPVERCGRGRRPGVVVATAARRAGDGRQQPARSTVASAARGADSTLDRRAADPRAPAPRRERVERRRTSSPAGGTPTSRPRARPRPRRAGELLGRGRRPARRRAHVAADAGHPHRQPRPRALRPVVDPGAPVVAAERAPLRRPHRQGQEADGRASSAPTRCTCGAAATTRRRRPSSAGSEFDVSDDPRYADLPPDVLPRGRVPGGRGRSRSLPYWADAIVPDLRGRAGRARRRPRQQPARAGEAPRRHRRRRHRRAQHPDRHAARVRARRRPTARPRCGRYLDPEAAARRPRRAGQGPVLALATSRRARHRSGSTRSPEQVARGRGRCGCARPRGPRRRRSRSTCTSRALRPGAPSGQPARPSASRLTTAPKRSSSAPASRASTGGKDTHPPPKRSTPSSSSSGTRSARARVRRSRRRPGPADRPRRPAPDPVLEVVDDRAAAPHPRRGAARGPPPAGAPGSAPRRATGRGRRPWARDRTSATFHDCFADVNASAGVRSAARWRRAAHLEHLGSIPLFSALSRKELAVSPRPQTRSP